LNIVFVNMRPFSHFVANGFRQRVGRVLHHFIRSDRVTGLAYIWWNEETRSARQDALPLDPTFEKVTLHEARRRAIPLARTLGFGQDLFPASRLRGCVRHCEDLKTEPLWIWATDPRLVLPTRHLADALGGKLACDLIDNFALFEDMGDARGAAYKEAYPMVAALADRIVANNVHMRDFGEMPSNRFLCVMNGVDWQLFHDSIGSPGPADLAGVPRPRVGFLGVLSSITDVGLLNAVARDIPECEVVCVGPTDRADQALHPRIHCLGLKPYSEAASYITSFDVGLSIYRVCPASRAGDSQKVYEYLAAGVPVVATNAQDHREKSALVRVADDEPEFVQMVREALREDRCAPARETRSRSVVQHDWLGRIAQILDFLEREPK